MSNRARGPSERGFCHAELDSASSNGQISAAFGFQIKFGMTASEYIKAISKGEKAENKKPALAGFWSVVVRAAHRIVHDVQYLFHEAQ